MTLDLSRKLEAAKGSRSDFDRFMEMVPSAPVAEGDKSADSPILGCKIKAVPRR
jgi:hypothetical protein